MAILPKHPVFVTMLLFLLAIISCGRDDPLRPTRRTQGQILFWGYEGSYSRHLYVVNGDGTGFHRLTTDSIPTSEPDWSPDGAKIVCVRGDSNFVTILNADGTNPIRLTDDYYAHSPSWSPDGTQIAYQSRDSIVIINADGSHPHAVLPKVGFAWVKPTTFLLDEENWISRWEFGDSLPTRIVFDINGGVPWPHSPRLSPTDSTVVFSASIGPSSVRLYTVKLDGTNLKEIPGVPEGAIYPVWSPDGRRIAWTELLHQSSIWTMKPDGSDIRLILPPDSESVFLGDWK